MSESDDEYYVADPRVPRHSTNSEGRKNKFKQSGRTKMPKLTEVQRMHHENVFRRTRYPSKEDIEELSRICGNRPISTIRIWFNDRRALERKRETMKEHGSRTSFSSPMKTNHDRQSTPAAAFHAMREGLDILSAAATAKDSDPLFAPSERRMSHGSLLPDEKSDSDFSDLEEHAARSLVTGPSDGIAHHAMGRGGPPSPSDVARPEPIHPASALLQAAGMPAAMKRDRDSDGGEDDLDDRGDPGMLRKRARKLTEAQIALHEGLFQLEVARGSYATKAEKLSLASQCNGRDLKSINNWLHLRRTSYNQQKKQLSNLAALQNLSVESLPRDFDVISWVTTNLGESLISASNVVFLLRLQALLFERQTKQLPLLPERPLDRVLPPPISSLPTPAPLRFPPLSFPGDRPRSPGLPISSHSLPPPQHPQSPQAHHLPPPQFLHSMQPTAHQPASASPYGHQSSASSSNAPQPAPGHAQQAQPQQPAPSAAQPAPHASQQATQQGQQQPVAKSNSIDSLRSNIDSPKDCSGGESPQRTPLASPHRDDACLARPHDESVTASAEDAAFLRRSAFETYKPPSSMHMGSFPGHLVAPSLPMAQMGHMGQGTFMLPMLPQQLVSAPSLFSNAYRGHSFAYRPPGGSEPSRPGSSSYLPPMAEFGGSPSEQEYAQRPSTR